MGDDVLKRHKHAWHELVKQAAVAEDTEDRCLEAYVTREVNGVPESMRIAWARKRPVKFDPAAKPRKGRKKVAAPAKDSKAWNWFVDPSVGSGAFKSWGEIEAWAQKHFLKEEEEPQIISVRTRTKRKVEQGMPEPLARVAFDEATEVGAKHVQLWTSQLHGAALAGLSSDQVVQVLRRIAAAEVRSAPTPVMRIGILLWCCMSMNYLK